MRNLVANRNRWSVRIGALTLALLLGSAPVFAAVTGNWLFAGHDISDTRFQSAESQISTANVGQLAPKWVFTTGGDVSATATVNNGVVYAVDWAGNIFAINANNGHAIWSHKISEYDGVPGALSRTSVAVNGSTLYLGDMPNTPTWPAGTGAHVIALDAASGALRWITQVDDHPASRITASPVVAGGTVYLGVSSDEENLATDPKYKCCTFRGSAIALDATSGRLLWKTFTVPPDFPGGAVWSSTAAIGNGSVFIATGNNYNVPSNVLNCQAHGGTDCLPANDLIDSILALDQRTGAVKWSSRKTTYDAWTVACLSNPPGPNCPSPAGADFDFGSGPNLFSGGGRQLVGAGQKSGIYWALDQGTGAEVWHTQVGPGGVAGGVEWGTATDGQQVYVEIANSSHTAWPLKNGPTTTGGFWSGLDAATGAINWQTADPFAAEDMGPPSVANGVVYVPGFDPQGHLFALNAVSGQILFSFASGGSSIAGASIVNGTVYWGSGYAHLAPGTPNNKLYAFKVP